MYKKRSAHKKKYLGHALSAKKIILYLLLGFILLWGISAIVLYKKYIQDLPSIAELENLEIAEASTIYDREWNELYNIFEEKRTYVRYESINENMIHAIVAWEDKRFFENPWVDLIGLIRAVLYRVIGKSDSLQGTSTLTQQLIRNTIITNERTAERKIKEIYLAYKLTNDVSKQKILELYLNKISFGSNAFWIEQAAKTFFGKSAQELSVLESSVLASLPKWPTYYSPYNNYDRVMGYPYIYSEEEKENTLNLITQEEIGTNNAAVNSLRDFIGNLKLEKISDSRALLCWLQREKLKQYISVDNDWCSILDYSEFLSLLNGIKIQIDESNIIEYQTGRKDFILWRMLEDGYINFDDYKESLLSSFGYKFEEYRENIKYPHFVFYIREYLEQQYGKEVIEKWWFKVYTSIDPVLQEKAEEIVKKYSEANERSFGASNAALVSIDNKTGEIVAMVWGRDYFDQENKWNVNIITSRLQPGSTFKPFVYSMAVDNEVIGTKTPVYDVKTVFPWNYIPNNFDGKFRGKMNITTALNYSRNIPAVKMFFLAGGESKIINFMENLWVTTLRQFKEEYFENHEREYSYWASMSLWTWLMTPLELAQAYSVFANMGVKKELMPITKILDWRWLVIEEFNVEENTGEQVLDASTAFIMNHMMSDTSSRPERWNRFLALSDRKVAAKTGTSTKQYTKNGEDFIFPRNLWTAGYTPQVTTIVWAGNTDGTELWEDGSGLTWAGPIWKEYMEFYHSDEAVENWQKPGWVKEVPISNISGEIAPEEYPKNLVVNSLFKNPPNSFDTNLQTVQVDLLCEGTVWPNTPQSAIKQVTLLAFHSLQKQNPAWENPVQAWVQQWWFETQLADLNLQNTIAYVNPEICERPDTVSNIEIWSTTKNGDSVVFWENYIEIAYRSTTPLLKLEAYIGGSLLQTIPLENKLQWVYRWSIAIPTDMGTGQKTLVLRAIDTYYYAKDLPIVIEILWRDPTPPSITITNPSDNNITLYKWDFFNLKGNVNDRWQIRSINIYLDDTPLKIGLTGRSFSYPIGSLNLEEWIHSIRVEAVDNDFKKWEALIQLEVLPSNETPQIWQEEELQIGSEDTSEVEPPEEEPTEPIQ